MSISETVPHSPAVAALAPTEDAQTRHADLYKLLIAMPSEERISFLRLVAPLPCDLEKLIVYLRLRAQAQSLENEYPLIKAIAAASSDTDWDALAYPHRSTAL